MQVQAFALLTLRPLHLFCFAVKFAQGKDMASPKKGPIAVHDKNEIARKKGVVVYVGSDKDSNAGERLQNEPNNYWAQSKVLVKTADKLYLKKALFGREYREDSHDMVYDTKPRHVVKHPRIRKQK